MCTRNNEGLYFTTKLNSGNFSRSDYNYWDDIYLNKFVIIADSALCNEQICYYCFRIFTFCTDYNTECYLIWFLRTYILYNPLMTSLLIPIR